MNRFPKHFQDDRIKMWLQACTCKNPLKIQKNLCHPLCKLYRNGEASLITNNELHDDLNGTHCIKCSNVYSYLKMPSHKYNLNTGKQGLNVILFAQLAFLFLSPGVGEYNVLYTLIFLSTSLERK